MRKLQSKLSTGNRYKKFDTEIIPHISALKSFALKMTNDLEESEDLLQDTLLKAFRFLDKFKIGTNAKSWLFKIMQNSFINNYRKIRKEPAKVDYEDIQNFYEHIKSNEVHSNHYIGDAFSDVLNDEIVNALSIMPDDFRTIVFLCDIEGFTYGEIADFMDSPIGTVRSRLHRARKMLYALLYQYAQKTGYVKSEKKETSNSIKEVINEFVDKSMV